VRLALWVRIWLHLCVSAVSARLVRARFWLSCLPLGLTADAAREEGRTCTRNLLRPACWTCFG